MRTATKVACRWWTPSSPLVSKGAEDVMHHVTGESPETNQARLTISRHAAARRNEGWIGWCVSSGQRFCFEHDLGVQWRKNTWFGMFWALRHNNPGHWHHLNIQFPNTVQQTKSNNAYVCTIQKTFCFANYCNLDCSFVLRFNWVAVSLWALRILIVVCWIDSFCCWSTMCWVNSNLSC